MSINEAGIRTYVAGEALAANRRVKINTSSQAVYAGAQEPCDGVTMDSAASAGYVAVKMNNFPGTRLMTCSGAVTAGNLVYGTSSGRIDDAASGVCEGRALETGSGDGAQIEVMPVPAAPSASGRVAEAHTADDTLLASESGSIHTSVGAGGAITITLPTALPGLSFFFQVGAAQNLILEGAGAETISLPSNGVAQANITANAVGESVYLVCCTAGTWAVMGYTGTWT